MPVTVATAGGRPARLGAGIALSFQPRHAPGCAVWRTRFVPHSWLPRCDPVSDNTSSPQVCKWAYLSLTMTYFSFHRLRCSLRLRMRSSTPPVRHPVADYSWTSRTLLPVDNDIPSPAVAGRQHRYKRDAFVPFKRQWRGAGPLGIHRQVPTRTSIPLTRRRGRPHEPDAGLASKTARPNVPPMLGPVVVPVVF